LRVLRGGAFFDDASYLRCAARYRSDPDFRSTYFGFRIVLASGFSSDL
jgi:formylglycine-generating enzyme required for sulfatase activity